MSLGNTGFTFVFRFRHSWHAELALPALIGRRELNSCRPPVPSEFDGAGSNRRNDSELCATAEPKEKRLTAEFCLTLSLLMLSRHIVGRINRYATITAKKHRGVNWVVQASSNPLIGQHYSIALCDSVVTKFAHWATVIGS